MNSEILNFCINWESTIFVYFLVYFQHILWLTNKFSPQRERTFWSINVDFFLQNWQILFIGIWICAPILIFVILWFFTFVTNFNHTWRFPRWNLLSHFVRYDTWVVVIVDITTDWLFDTFQIIQSFQLNLLSSLFQFWFQSYYFIMGVYWIQWWIIIFIWTS